MESDNHKKEVRKIEPDKESISIMNIYESGDQKTANGMMINKLSGYIGNMINTRFINFKRDGLYYDFFDTGCVAVLEKMPLYDSRKSAPPTFFGPYIHRAMCRLAGWGAIIHRHIIRRL